MRATWRATSGTLFGGGLGCSAQAAEPVDDAVAIGMSDGLDHVQALGAVAKLRMRRGARGQVPLDSIALTTRSDLPAGADECSEVHALGHRGDRDLRVAVAHGLLAV